VKQALKQLLNALDEISKTHAEVSDAANREAMTKAIYQGFVLPKNSYKLPARFGMPSTEGNRLVREALAAFLAHPDAAFRSKDLTPDARRTAFQDANIVSSLGHRCHHYFDAYGLRSREERKVFAQKLLPPKGHLPPYPRRKNYQMGDWFAIPLRTKGFGLGLVARAKRGRCLGYFFGPLHLSLPSLRDCAGLTAKGAKFVERFSDYHIRVEYWPKLGVLPGWNKDDWPMPVFASMLLGYFTAHYPDDDPAVDPNLVRSTEEELQGLPKDRFAGSGAVEIMLTKALDAAAYETTRR
jgi:Immunity protein 26